MTVEIDDRVKIKIRQQIAEKFCIQKNLLGMRFEIDYCSLWCGFRH